jgi:hypothetical protein
MKVKVISALFALLIFSIQIYATAQYPDKIIYNGKEYDLHSNPMEDYFEKFPDKKPKTEIMSSGLWRGYVATFEIVENKLFLKDIQIMVSKKTADKSFEIDWKSVLKEVVQEKDKLKIDWFSGLLVVPHGKLINYVHMGYGSTFENYILLEIFNGNFIKAKEFGYENYEKFKERQFRAFKLTEEYKQLIERERKSKDFDEKFFNDFLRSFITNYTSKILVD